MRDLVVRLLEAAFMKPSSKTEPSTSKFRLGVLLVSSHTINRAQLRTALTYQKSHPHQPLGQILIKQEGISRKRLSRCISWQSRLRSTGLVLSLMAAPFHTAWADALTPRHSSGINWTTHCQDSICMSQQATPMGVKNAPPTLVLELKPSKMLRALGIIDRADAVEEQKPPGQWGSQPRYHIGLSPEGIAVGFQFRF
jgi:hypothetical protein